MAGTAITNARVGAFKPCKTAGEVRDGRPRGFGVRVLPSGCEQHFIQCRHPGVVRRKVRTPRYSE